MIQPSLRDWNILILIFDLPARLGMKRRTVLGYFQASLRDSSLLTSLFSILPSRLITTTCFDGLARSAEDFCQEVD